VRRLGLLPSLVTITSPLTVQHYISAATKGLAVEVMLSRRLSAVCNYELWSPRGSTPDVTDNYVVGSPSRWRSKMPKSSCVATTS
jgi:hypothetical protein